MKRSIVRLACLVALLGASAEAAPPEKFVFRLKGLSGSVSAYMDDGECIFRSVFLFASEETTHTPGEGPPVTTESVWLSYSTYNYCTGVFTSGFGYTTDADVSGSPSRLRVLATLEVVEYPEGTVREVIADLTLDGNGEFRSHGVSNFHFRSPDSMGHFRFVGSDQSADVIGTITLDGENLLDDFETVFGSISLVRSGSMTIYRFSPPEPEPGEARNLPRRRMGAVDGRR